MSMIGEVARGCDREGCAWWHGEMGECKVGLALGAIPPALSELNAHLADLVELGKGLKWWDLGQAPK